MKNVFPFLFEITAKNNFLCFRGIITMSNIQFILVNRRYLYFSSVSNSPQISRADMDGNNKIVLANLSHSGSTVIDVALDKPNNRLFFSDQSNNVIRYIDLASMEVRTLLSGNLHGPTSLTILNNTLYWISQGSGKFSGALFKAEANPGSPVQMIADGFSYPYGITAYNSRVSQIPGR